MCSPLWKHVCCRLVAVPFGIVEHKKAESASYQQRSGIGSRRKKRGEIEPPLHMFTPGFGFFTQLHVFCAPSHLSRRGLLAVSAWCTSSTKIWKYPGESHNYHARWLLYHLKCLIQVVHVPTCTSYMHWVANSMHKGNQKLIDMMGVQDNHLHVNWETSTNGNDFQFGIAGILDNRGFDTARVCCIVKFLPPSFACIGYSAKRKMAKQLNTNK